MAASAPGVRHACAPRTDADHRDAPAPPPAALGLDDRGRLGDGAGAALAPRLGHGERAVQAGAGECRGLRHAVAADRAEHRLRRRREPGGLAFQRRGVEEAERHAKPRRDGVHRRLVGLQVERDDAGHCLRREPSRHEHALGEPDELLRVAAPLAADAEGQDGGMQGDIGHVVARHHTPLGDVHREAAPVPERRAAGGEPIGRRSLGHEAHRLACQQRGGHGLHQRAFAEAPAGRRCVEGESQCRVAGGGDRRAGAEGVGDGAGKPVRAVVPAQQGNDAPTVFGDGDDRRLGALVREMRGEEADEDAGGADADDRRPGAEERGEVGRQAFICDIGSAFERRGAVDCRTGQCDPDTLRQPRLAPVEDHHRGPVQHHAAPRLWTMIMEK